MANKYEYYKNNSIRKKKKTEIEKVKRLLREFSNGNTFKNSSFNLRNKYDKPTYTQDNSTENNLIDQISARTNNKNIDPSLTNGKDKKNSFLPISISKPTNMSQHQLNYTWNNQQPIPKDTNKKKNIENFNRGSWTNEIKTFALASYKNINKNSNISRISIATDRQTVLDWSNPFIDSINSNSSQNNEYENVNIASYENKKNQFPFKDILQSKNNDEKTIENSDGRKMTNKASYVMHTTTTTTNTFDNNYNNGIMFTNIGGKNDAIMKKSENILEKEHAKKIISSNNTTKKVFANVAKDFTKHERDKKDTESDKNNTKIKLFRSIFNRSYYEEKPKHKHKIRSIKSNALDPFTVSSKKFYLHNHLNQKSLKKPNQKASNFYHHQHFDVKNEPLHSSKNKINDNFLIAHYNDNHYSNYYSHSNATSQEIKQRLWNGIENSFNFLCHTAHNGIFVCFSTCFTAPWLQFFHHK